MAADPNFMKPWHGVAREEIEWYPIVVADRYIGCGMCVTSCGRQVYAFDYEANVAVVEHPLQCMVGCTTCATICTRDAVEFPSQGYIRQVIREKKTLRQAKDMLKENQEQYDIRRRDETPTERDKERATRIYRAMSNESTMQHPIRMLAETIRIQTE